MKRVWYGDPGTALAELPSPQSRRLAMWPPQARTTWAELAWKVILSRWEESGTDQLPRLPSALFTYCSDVIVPL